VNFEGNGMMIDDELGGESTTSKCLLYVLEDAFIADHVRVSKGNLTYYGMDPQYSQAPSSSARPELNIFHIPQAEN
jgi:hypothetical protein